ncbi:hypothetical protein ACFQX6_48740 [Streptosporangium lutulentum]
MDVGAEDEPGDRSDQEGQGEQQLEHAGDGDGTGAGLGDFHATDDRALR